MKIVCPRVICGNRGDLLSRLGILQCLKHLELHDVSVFCHDPKDIAPFSHETVAYGRIFNFFPGRRGKEVLRDSTVLWTGGLDLQDDSSILKLLHTWMTFRKFRSLGCRIISVMQGAGPLTTRKGRWLARRILNTVDCFITRDNGTHRLLQDIGGNARLLPAYDGIFAPCIDDGPISQRERLAVEQIVNRTNGRKLIGVNVRMWFHFRNSMLPYFLAKNSYKKRSQKNMDRFISATVRMVELLRKRSDARIVLLSMYEPHIHPWEDDLPYLVEIKKSFPQDDQVIVQDEPLGLAAFCQLMQRLDLMIGTRLHSTLTALRFGVPAINIAYTLKCSDIFADLGLKENIIGIDDFMNHPDSILHQAMEMLDDTTLRSAIQRKVDQCTERNLQALAGALGIDSSARKLVA